MSEKTNWPRCPSCKKDFESLRAFDGRRFDWQTITCECAHVYQVRYTENMEFESRAFYADRTFLPHFPLPIDHVGQEL